MGEFYNGTREAPLTDAGSGYEHGAPVAEMARNTEVALRIEGACLPETR